MKVVSVQNGTPHCLLTSQDYIDAEVMSLSTSNFSITAHKGRPPLTLPETRNILVKIEDFNLLRSCVSFRQVQTNDIEKPHAML